MGWLKVPLLFGAAVIAVAVIGSGALVPRRRGSDPAARFGEFTIPIGATVIGSGVAQFGGSVPAIGAVAIVTSAWIYTGFLMASVVFPLISSTPGLGAADGTWFLAPAALLGDGIGVAALAGKHPNHLAVLGWLAFGVVAVGAVSYLLVAGLAAARVAARGVAGTPAAPWWIAAGCGGLSAAAIGRTSEVFPINRGAELLHVFGFAALALWVLGSVALVPVLAGSIRYLARLRHLAGRPSWPPTFSTGVYALGAGQVSRLVGAPIVAAVATAAGAATIFLWVLTLVAYAPRLPGLVRGSQREFDEPVA